MDAKELISQGRLSEESGDLNKAYQCYLEAATSFNDAEAYYRLGNMYLEGDYVGNDYDKAGHYLETAHDLGFNIGGEMFVYIGSCYERGDAYHEKNTQEAIKWYQMAVDDGLDYAYACLGRVFFEGDGVETDYKKAYDCFTLAEEEGTLPLYYLGQMYENGYFVEKNINKAIEYYKRILDEYPNNDEYGDETYFAAEKKLQELLH